jgi:hypothetical protein
MNKMRKRETDEKKEVGFPYFIVMKG